MNMQSEDTSPEFATNDLNTWRIGRLEHRMDRAEVAIAATAGLEAAIAARRALLKTAVRLAGLLAMAALTLSGHISITELVKMFVAS